MLTKHEVHRHPKHDPKVTDHKTEPRRADPKPENFYLVGQLEADGPVEILSDKATIKIGDVKLERTSSGGISYDIELVVTEPKAKADPKAEPKPVASSPEQREKAIKRLEEHGYTRERAERFVDQQGAEQVLKNVHEKPLIP